MIGQPVTKVRSPPLLESRFAQVGVDAEVETLDLAPRDLDSFVRSVESDDTIDGLVVTMPHKRALVRRLEALSSTAALVGSVNTVKRTRGGGLVGAQFDGIALINALRGKAVPVGHARVLLLGAGGAGMAIAHALCAHGCRSLAIGDKDSALVDAAVERLGDDALCNVSTLTEWGGVGYELLINATPVGMEDDDPCPFSEAMVAGASWVADIVADPPRTRLAEYSAQMGVTLVSGRDMVKGQIGPIFDWLLSDEVEQPV